MEQASERLDFEQAAVFRDQIASLRRVQERQYVSGESGDLDRGSVERAEQEAWHQERAWMRLEVRKDF